MSGNEVSVPLPDDGGSNQNGHLVRFEKYEGTVILGFAVFAVVAVTSFLPRAVMTIALVVVVVVFLLVWKKIKRRLLASAPPPPSEMTKSSGSPSDSDTQTCLSKIYDDRLAKYEAQMRTGISLHGLVPLLEVPAGGFMTQEERIVVTSKESDPEKVSKIISILRKKTDKNYVKFCDILDKSGNEDWANCLRISENPSSDVGTMTPMEPMLDGSSSVQPDMDDLLVDNAGSRRHSAYRSLRFARISTVNSASYVLSSADVDMDEIVVPQAECIFQDDKTSAKDDSRVPSDDELFKLSILLLESPFQRKGWRRLCYRLGIPKYVIKENHRLEGEFEMFDVLIRWRDEYSSQYPSWRFLLSAIEDTYGRGPADYIHSRFHLPKVWYD